MRRLILTFVALGLEFFCYFFCSSKKSKNEFKYDKCKFNIENNKIMKKALITEEFHPCLRLGLEELGYTCDEIWDIDTLGVINCISDYHLLIINSKIKVDATLLKNASQLKVIARIGSGLEIIDIETCKERGIRVISTPEGNANAVAEHVLGFILSALNNLMKSQNDLLLGNWLREENRGEELCGKTIGIIGCGHNGGRLVQLLSGFDTEVLIYDIRDIRSKIKNPNAREVDSMDEIYERADIISFHIPLTNDTKSMVNRDFLGKFKKNIYLINAARGKICDMDTILYGIESGKLIKVMLDVFENEPLALNLKLITAVQENRLFISPHIAGWTVESKKKMAEMVILALQEA
jgi:D-3-phosphoglycerate dehydrogenase / 2-oxoglutarate reductase